MLLIKSKPTTIHLTTENKHPSNNKPTSLVMKLPFQVINPKTSPIVMGQSTCFQFLTIHQALRYLVRDSLARNQTHSRHRNTSRKTQSSTNLMMLTSLHPIALAY